ncbi:MAG: pyridoxamine 5-phosphate oxidase [Hyphomicrobiales bacterium]|nr:MAG: pyridoxamine 5-phosphate oxidase [Hyphomicrobiales bacterium]
MLHKYLELASTPAVKAARQHYGSAAQYARIDGTLDPRGAPRNDRIGPEEAAFIAARDGFYIASVSETGWPYVQFRGGPTGFLQILDDRTLGFTDFRGNRQYLTTGNVAGNDRISLFLMDYAQQRRLKIFGRMRIVDVNDDPELAARLSLPAYRATAERAVSISVEAFDWNCPQHITPRFTEAEIADLLQPFKTRMTALEAENVRLRTAASGLN